MLLIYIELSAQILQAKVLTQPKFATDLVHSEPPPPSSKVNIVAQTYDNQSSKPFKNAD